MTLEITEVRIRMHRGQPDEILKAFASITLNDCFAVHNLKVIAKEEGLFVSMPARRNRDGAFSDIAHPINKPFREYMEGVVLGAYERETGNGSG
ncbi:MAG: putative septation protein SpoVG 2 [Gemmatimonadota bacterium]|nr:MAG: putative septation protein SpoVG 2 [Gemmatimonadota bacterium]